MALPAQKTKIVATIGPASDSLATMEAMLRAGMTIARLNFSHGDFDAYRRVIANLRKAAAAVGQPVAILADLPGPKMRIGTIAPEPIELKPGDTFTLTTEHVTGNAHRASVSFRELPDRVRQGDTLFLADGSIQLEVSAVQGRDVVCRVEVGGEIRSRKGLNLPGIDLGIRAFTDRDRECLAFAMAEGVDAVSQSFVESAADIHAVREAAAASGHAPLVIAKLERSRALDNLEAILDAADGVMVARGDLGVEIPIEMIAIAQKHILRQANLRGKPVITATQMLESMITNRRPTRAEATDVANAILDGTDAVMLSGESAMGRYPVESVAMLARIAQAVERFRPGAGVREELRARTRADRPSVTDAIAFSLNATVERLSPAIVVIPTRGGTSARSVTRFRLPMWIVAACSHEATCQQLRFSWGVHPVSVAETTDDWRTFTRQFLAQHGIDGHIAVLSAGPSPGNPHANHRMEVIELGDGASSS
jgi:pyruvate kinase